MAVECVCVCVSITRSYNASMKQKVPVFVLACVCTLLSHSLFHASPLYISHSISPLRAFCIAISLTTSCFILFLRPHLSLTFRRSVCLARGPSFDASRAYAAGIYTYSFARNCVCGKVTCPSARCITG